MALPYKVKLHYSANNYQMTIRGIDAYSRTVDITGDGHRFIAVPVDEIKPYLRPMSSMTEEETVELEELLYPAMEDSNGDYYSALLENDVDNYITFMMSHHFDFRGLIERGLAIEITEENNPYKD